MIRDQPTYVERQSEKPLHLIGIFPRYRGILQLLVVPDCRPQKRPRLLGLQLREGDHLHQREQAGEVVDGRFVHESVLEAEGMRLLEEGRARGLTASAGAEERCFGVVASVRGERFDAEERL